MASLTIDPTRPPSYKHLIVITPDSRAFFGGRERYYFCAYAIAGLDFFARPAYAAMDAHRTRKQSSA